MRVTRSLRAVVSSPNLRVSPVSVTRQMAAALPQLQKVAAEKGLKMHHLGAGYPHPEVSDPTDYIEHKANFFKHLGPEVSRYMYNYTDTMGPLGPRQAFAQVYGNDFDIPSMDPDLCIPTVGASGAISLLCSLYERSGTSVAYMTDAPTYAGFLARATLSSNAHIYSADMDEEGVIIDALRSQIHAARAAGHRVAFYYTVPDGHNPGGISFSVERRKQIMQLMREEGIYVVEDAPYNYITFGGKDSRKPPLVALDAAHAVHLFTASKIGLPGPRVGFMYTNVAIQAQQDQLVSLRDLILTEASSDVLFQNPEALYGFQAYLSDKDFNTRDSIWPLAEAKLAVYGENRSILLEGLERRLGRHPDHFSWTKPGAGFFSVFTFKNPAINTDASFTNRLISEYGVVTVPMFGFFPADARERNPKAGLDQVRLSFCFNEKQGEGRRQDMREAVEAFADAALKESGLPLD